ncbi:HNH endonuclease signature motif containing protein [Bacillus licheniformis]
MLPLARGGTHDRSNLMALCTPCHSAITLYPSCRTHGISL